MILIISSGELYDKIEMMIRSEYFNGEPNNVNRATARWMKSRPHPSFASPGFIRPGLTGLFQSSLARLREGYPRISTSGGIIEFSMVDS